MKTLFPLVWLVLQTVALRAQFYAPEPEFHDRAQRNFPVEAARVLAALQNSRGADIAEITYKLETADNQDVVWQIQWLDVKKKTLREKTVRYSQALLTTGPKYFREVFGQVAADVTLPKGEGRGFDAEFWEGAKLAGVSRLESLAEAGKQVATGARLDKAPDAARLAGTLAHGAVPVLASPQTLDALLLGRAAAWLCIAERIDGTTDDATWAPILFLAGRERYARAAWDAAAAPVGGDRGAAGRFWKLILHTPSTTDCFLFAARKANHQFAMPAMIYPAAFDKAWMSLLVTVADEVVGKDAAPRFYEYGPNISIRGGVAGGHWGERMPGIAMKAWFDAVSSFRPMAHDFAGYQTTLKEVARDLAAQEGAAHREPVTALAPLLNLGLDQGTGPLPPVATVTARDLLVYGWETAGLEYGYTYDALAGSIGDPRSAQALARLVLGRLKGAEVFFRNPTTTPVEPLSDLRRLQYVGSSIVENLTVEKLPVEWAKPSTHYIAVRWLDRGGIGGIEAMIRGQAKPDEVRAMIDRLRHEGGPLAICNLANRDPGMKFSGQISALGLRKDLLADMPWQCSARTRAVQDEVKDRGFEYATLLEQISWDNLEFTDNYLIFSGYIFGGAERSAKRFYDQVRPFITERVGFSNNTGPARYALAWIEGDEEMEKQVLADVAVESYSDFRLRTTHAILHGNYEEAGRSLDKSFERYNNQRDPMLKAYLPQIPALLDVGNADHASAIANFPNDDRWLFLRWALAKQAKLSADDAVHLFHDKTEGPEGIFAAAAKGDKGLLRKLYSQVGLNAPERVIIAHEYFKQTGAKAPEEQPDLMPPGTRSIQDLVREELRKQGN